MMRTKQNMLRSIGPFERGLFGRGLLERGLSGGGLVSRGLVAAILLGGAGGVGAAQPHDPPVAPPLAAPVDPPPEAPVGEGMAFARALSNAFKAAADAIAPSVVHIMTESEQEVVRRDVFGRPVRGRQVSRGLGSGVVVRADGIILTNNHVVRGATSLTVRLSDGREAKAQIVGTDEATDLAVLRVVDGDGLSFHAAAFGDSDAIGVGEWVIAAGSPFGLSQTVTAGIVSAKGRTGLSGNDADAFEDFIQTDAAINPGNSGGPLVDLDGRVVGINTAIFSRSGGSQGIGFAIPSNMARGVLESILANGRVIRGWLGVRWLDLRPEALDRLGVRQTGGVYIEYVEPGSPADEAGLREGDVIVTLNGAPAGDLRRLRSRVGVNPPGSTVRLGVLREGRRIEVRPKLADVSVWVAERTGRVASTRLGLVVETIGEPMRLRLGIAGSGIEGVVVTGVVEGAPGEAAMLRPGDVITHIGGVPTGDEEAFRRLADGADLDAGVRVDLIRESKRRYTTLKR